MKHLFLLFSLSLATIGCVSNEAKMDLWLDTDVNNLIASWGKPDSIIDTDNDRRIIKYSHSRIGGSSALERHLFPKVFYCNADFVVDNEGKIVEANAEGNLEGCNYLIKGRP